MGTRLKRVKCPSCDWYEIFSIDAHATKRELAQQKREVSGSVACHLAQVHLIPEIEQMLAANG